MIIISSVCVFSLSSPRFCKRKVPENKGFRIQSARKPDFETLSMFIDNFVNFLIWGELFLLSTFNTLDTFFILSWSRDKEMKSKTNILVHLFFSEGFSKRKPSDHCWCLTVIVIENVLGYKPLQNIQKMVVVWDRANSSIANPVNIFVLYIITVIKKYFIF